MDQNHEPADSSAEVTEQSEPNQEPENHGESSLDAGGDWDKAREAFEEFSDVEPEQVEEPALQEADSKSHFEQDKPNTGGDLDLEKLAVPGKYKSKVQEFVKPLIEESQRKIEAANESLGQYTEANQSLLSVFKEIAADPAKLIDYAVQYGDQIGLDRETVERYRGMKSGNRSEPQQPQPVAPQGQDPIKAISMKYRDKLLKAASPEEFADIQDMRDAEFAQVVRGETLGMLKQLLGGYHEKAISPLLKDREESSKRAEQEARVGGWRQSIQSTSAKYKDFSAYESRVVEMMKTDPRYVNLASELNSNAASAKQKGLTHEFLLEKAYLELSQADRLKELSTPKPREWKGGLQPNAKHITTTRAGTAGNWDAIKEDFFS